MKKKEKENYVAVMFIFIVNASIEEFVVRETLH